MRRNIFTVQIGVRLTPEDRRAIMRHRRSDEQLSDAVRRLIRVGVAQCEATKSTQKALEKEVAAQ